MSPEDNERELLSIVTEAVGDKVSKYYTKKIIRLISSSCFLVPTESMNKSCVIVIKHTYIQQWAKRRGITLSPRDAIRIVKKLERIFDIKKEPLSSALLNKLVMEVVDNNLVNALKVRLKEETSNYVYEEIAADTNYEEDDSDDSEEESEAEGEDDDGGYSNLSERLLDDSEDDEEPIEKVVRKNRKSIIKNDKEL